MPREKKPARDLTTDEVIKRLFPKPIRDAAKDEAKKAEQPREKPKGSGRRSIKSDPT